MSCSGDDSCDGVDCYCEYEVEKWQPYAGYKTCAFPVESEVGKFNSCIWNITWNTVFFSSNKRAQK